MSDWDRQTTPGAVEGPQWVSAAEAADLAGVTPGTVRYWARNGLIVSEIVEGPAGEKTLVRLEEVLQHARQERPSRSAGPGQGPGGPSAAPPADVVTDLPARTSELAPILKSIPEIMAQLTAATDRAARAETKVEFLSAQLADLRRRLADAEAGRDGGGPAATVPEAWETPEEPAAAEATFSSPAEEQPAAGATGWPVPPPSELRNEPPADTPDPGPDTIDWTTGAVTDTGTPAAEEEVAAEPASDPTPEPVDRGYSLDDIWNQPPAPAPAAETLAPRLDDAEGGIDWHEPAGGPPPPPAPAEEEPAPTPRLANAPVPEGDDFYGPRRRRWFKRRR
jgi:hypothetical protein